jgi:hypothetical protein
MLLSASLLRQASQSHLSSANLSVHTTQSRGKKNPPAFLAIEDISLFAILFERIRLRRRTVVPQDEFALNKD